MVHAVVLSLALTQAIRTAEASAIIVNAVATETADGKTDSGSGTCSGFILARSETGTDALAATAGHCASSQTEDGVTENVVPYGVQFFDGDLGSVTSYVAAPNDDVAFMFIHSQRQHSVVALGGDIQRAQDLFAFSDPLDFSWSFIPATPTQGPTYTGADAPWQRTEALSCASCAPGVSGGGVWDRGGRLVGMTVAGNGYVTLMVPTARVLAALKDIAPKLNCVRYPWVASIGACPILKP